MRKSFSVGFMLVTPDVPNRIDITGLFGNIENNLSFLKDCGYSGVEFMTIDPTEVDAKVIAHKCRLLDLTPTMVCTGELFGTLGLSFTDDSDSVARDAVKAVKRMIDLAAELDANINIGRVRGKINNDRERWDTAVRSIKEICGYALPKGVDVLLEPLEEEETDFINSLQEAIDFTSSIGIDSMGIMVDTCAASYEIEELPVLFEKYVGKHYY